MGHMLGISEPSQPSGPGQPAGHGFNAGPGTWPGHYSFASSAPALTPSIAMFHTVLSRPIPIINQAIVSTASCGLRTPDGGSHPSDAYQSAPFVPQNPYDHQRIPPAVLPVKKALGQPHLSYASTEPSGSAAGIKLGRDAPSECVIDPQLDSSLSNTTPKEYSTLHSSHTRGLSVGVSDEESTRRKREGDASENAAQGPIGHIETTFLAGKLLNDSLVPP